ncbi:hypothetical protein PS1_000326 [Malus domestica]
MKEFDSRFDGGNRVRSRVHRIVKWHDRCSFVVGAERVARVDDAIPRDAEGGVVGLARDVNWSLLAYFAQLDVGVARFQHGAWSLVRRQLGL